MAMRELARRADAVRPEGELPWSSGGHAKRHRCESLVAIKVKRKCILDQTYGCYDPSVEGFGDFWVKDGCRGLFRCSGAPGRRSCGSMLDLHLVRTSNTTKCWCSAESAAAASAKRHDSSERLLEAVGAPPIPRCIDVSRSEHGCAVYDALPELCARAQFYGQRCVALKGDKEGEGRCAQPGAAALVRSETRQGRSSQHSTAAAEEGPVTFGVSYKGHSPCVGHDGDPYKDTSLASQLNSNVLWDHGSETEVFAHECSGEGGPPPCAMTHFWAGGGVPGYWPRYLESVVRCAVRSQRLPSVVAVPPHPTSLTSPIRAFRLSCAHVSTSTPSS